MLITILIFTFFWMFPFAFRILRNNYAFIAFILLSIIYVLLEYNLIYNNLNNINIPKKSEFLYSLNPLVFLITFKVIDLFFLKFKRRHIYFRARSFNEFSEGEAEKAGFIDTVFQILLALSLFLTLIISGQDKI